MVNHAHACLAGYQKGSEEQEALGHSKGVFSYKVHTICDTQSLPLNFILTGGQSADCTPAILLLENISAEAVLADKAYDTNDLRDWLRERKIKVVIPPKSNRTDDIFLLFLALQRTTCGLVYVRKTKILSPNFDEI